MFTKEEIVCATDNFAAHRELGAGSFGKVYSARLLSGVLVAVKRMCSDAGHNNDSLRTSFYTELAAARDIGEHPHVISIIGEVGALGPVWRLVSNGMRHHL